MSTGEDFIAQPFVGDFWDAEGEEKLPAILLFGGDTSNVSTSELSWFGFPPDSSAAECPSGLYLSPCERLHRYPPEDGINLALPFNFAAGWAKQSDFTSVCQDEFTPGNQNDKLLQAGVNPYNDMHPAQLQAFLGMVYSNVQRGHWAADAHGVAGGLDV